MKNTNKRFLALDGLRGLTVISMIIYHAMWDLVFLFDVNISWFRTNAAYIWQQSICYTFILLSGFCFSLGRKRIRRGLTVFLAGFLIALVTGLIMPNEAIYFGVLTLLGSCMLITAALERPLKRCNPFLGLVLCAGLFVITRNINSGGLGFENWEICSLPRALYRNLATAYLGFPPIGFRSADYFSLVPWIFLFGAGYFLYGVVGKKGLPDFLRKERAPFLEKIGRRSLLVYIVHQPVIYGVLYLVFMIKRV